MKGAAVGTQGGRGEREASGVRVRTQVRPTNTEANHSGQEAGGDEDTGRPRE